MMKFRAAIGGFFGVLGYKILGLPGMLFGMLFGATSVWYLNFIFIISCCLFDCIIFSLLH